MSDVVLTASRTMAVPAEVVYAAIADYRTHHRPEGFLPPAFESLEVLEGGVGEGTRIRTRFRSGRTVRTMDARITEPEPGRVLVEAAPGLVTTFRVEPARGGTTVTFRTVLEARGISGFFTRRLAPGMLLPVYADELERLERYTAALAGAAPARSAPATAAVPGPAAA